MSHLPETTTEGGPRRRSATSRSVSREDLLPAYTHRCAVASKILMPVHPFCSIRRSEGRGASPQIPLPASKLLRTTVPYLDISDVRSRRPAASELASESHLRSPCGISGPAGQSARGTRALSRGSRISLKRVARGQPIPSICWRTPERSLAAKRSRGVRGTYIRRGGE